MVLWTPRAVSFWVVCERFVGPCSIHVKRCVLYDHHAVCTQCVTKDVFFRKVERLRKCHKKDFRVSETLSSHQFHDSEAPKRFVVPPDWWFYPLNFKTLTTQYIFQLKQRILIIHGVWFASEILDCCHMCKHALRKWNVTISLIFSAKFLKLLTPTTESMK